jgi:hypothetical protein
MRAGLGGQKPTLCLKLNTCVGRRWPPKSLLLQQWQARFATASRCSLPSAVVRSHHAAAAGHEFFQLRNPKLQVTKLDEPDPTHTNRWSRVREISRSTLTRSAYSREYVQCTTRWGFERAAEGRTQGPLVGSGPELRRNMSISTTERFMRTQTRCCALSAVRLHAVEFQGSSLPLEMNSIVFKSGRNNVTAGKYRGPAAAGGAPRARPSNRGQRRACRGGRRGRARGRATAATRRNSRSCRCPYS